MDENNELIKIRESRYIVIIPMIITIVCAWLDIWTNFSSGTYSEMGVMECSVNIIRCCMGYLFPSLLSIVIAMVWQQSCLKSTTYGIEPDRVSHAVVLTVVYSTIFITCLIKYNLVTAILLVVFTVAYGVWFYVYCMDKHIKIKNKNQMSEEELLKIYAEKMQRKKGKNE